MARHHPGALEFTPEYLLALWQASHCSLHSTFMFDSIKEFAQTLKVSSRSRGSISVPPFDRSGRLYVSLKEACSDPREGVLPPS